MLHPCTKRGSKVDIGQVWSGFRAATLEWTVCGVRLWCSWCAETEQILTCCTCILKVGLEVSSERVLSIPICIAHGAYRCGDCFQTAVLLQGWSSLQYNSGGQFLYSAKRAGGIP